VPTEPRPKTDKFTDFLDPKKFSVEVKTLESAPERDSRIRRDEEDAAHDRARKKAAEEHERRKDFLLFVASLIVVAGSAFCCLGTLIFSPTSSPWAGPLLTLIVGGLLGYQTGKSQSKGDH